MNYRIYIILLFFIALCSSQVFGQNSYILNAEYDYTEDDSRVVRYYIDPDPCDGTTNFLLIEKNDLNTTDGSVGTATATNPDNLVIEKRDLNGNVIHLSYTGIQVQE